MNLTSKLLFSAHIITQRAGLQDHNAMLLCFWYSLLGVVTSFVPSAIFETMTLKLSSLEWTLMLGHCFGSAGFAIFAGRQVIGMVKKIGK